jgi:chromosome segregation ATPase
MAAENPVRDDIFDSIKYYLYQFESYSKAIAEIQKLCDIPQDELKKLPKEMQDIKLKQKTLSNQIIEESSKLKGLINQQKKNARKIEKVYQDMNDLNVKLLEIDEKLKALNLARDSAKACDEVGSEVKSALSTQYKIVLDKLKEARIKYPDIYKQVEDETGIHFFTPFA